MPPFQRRQVPLPIGVVPVDHLAPIPARGDVIQGALELDARGRAMAERVAGKVAPF